MRDRYVVAASLAGRLLRLPVRAGDPVTVDQVVATIRPAPPALLSPRARSELEERVGAADAGVVGLQAQAERSKDVLEQAEADGQRARALRKSGVVSAQQLEHVELAVQTAEPELHAADMRRHVAEHVLD